MHPNLLVRRLSQQKTLLDFAGRPLEDLLSLPVAMFELLCCDVSKNSFQNNILPKSHRQPSLMSMWAEFDDVDQCLKS